MTGDYGDTGCDQFGPMRAYLAHNHLRMNLLARSLYLTDAGSNPPGDCSAALSAMMRTSY